jgi:hypothetical protein
MQAASQPATVDTPLTSDASDKLGDMPWFFMNVSLQVDVCTQL